MSVWLWSSTKSFSGATDCRGFLTSYGQGPLNSWVLPSCWCYRRLWEFDKGLHGSILFCVFNVLRKRKALASGNKQFFAMSKSLSVEALYLNVLCQPPGCPQRAESNQTAKEQHLQVCSSKPSFKHTWKYSNQLGHRVICAAWQNTTLERACHCACSSAKHGLSFQRHPVLAIKVLSLFSPIIPRAEPCCAALMSAVGCTGDISPCFSSALGFITDVKHKACTPLAVCLPCSRDSWCKVLLEGHNSFAAHTNIWIMPICCRKNCSLIKNGKVIRLQSKVKLYAGYWSSR